MKSIRLWGVKQNNLKNIEVQIPLGSMAVICGPSGSGKSSLAFETLYAEGQRRYIESLSNYTKQFLNKAPKPDVEGVENIPPALALEQKNSVKSSRSTVGTTTEVIDYLRLLYEKLGQAFCPHHHVQLEKDNVISGTKKIINEFKNKRGYILAPVPAENRLLTGRKLYELLLKEGYLRLYKPSKTKLDDKSTIVKSTTKKALKEIDKVWPVFDTVKVGEILDIKDPKLKKSVPKDLFYIVIDRLAFTEKDESRIIDSISQCFKASIKFNTHSIVNRATVLTTDGEQLLLSENLSCSVCGYEFPNITSQLFSFNSPAGACEECKGFGNVLSLDEEKVIPNPKLSLYDGALVPFEMKSAKSDRKHLLNYCKKVKIDVHTPWEELAPKQRKLIWDGSEDFYGVVGLFDYLETKKYKMHVRVFLSRYKCQRICKSCEGTRLRKESQQVLLRGNSITDLCSLSIKDLILFFDSLKLSKNELDTCKEVYYQICTRLKFLNDVGVGYLTLDRQTKTLSGGEYQRLSLSNQLGMGLSQTLYVLDEPTVGLHPRDNDRLIKIMKELRDLGNTLVIVEHDHDVIKNSSYVVEMGPGSGHLGGEVLFSGSQEEFMIFPDSNTNHFLKPNSSLATTKLPRPVDIETYRYKLEMKGCNGNNLKNVNLILPLNRFVTVTGVSGSGKSTLISHTLYPALARELGVEFTKGFDYKSLNGFENVKHVLLIDQTPIGKTARSNLMTYLKIYDAIRQLMASSSEAQQRGYSAGTFSLNVDGGRCPVCKGLGYEVIDMMFMDDIHMICDSCDGKKFRQEVLEITYKGLNIVEIMNLTVAEAMDFFVSYPNIRRPLSLLKEVGLDYIRLGQSANSLSGGESQRLKVARELNNSSQKSTLYILDEPTTGLHFKEIHLLIRILNRLVDAGNSVLLIEHNLEIIKGSDYIIDIGPEAGKEGGKIVAQGTPEEIMLNKKSLTGQYLKDYIQMLVPKNLIRSKKVSEAET